MPALVIIDSDAPEQFHKYLVGERGYQASISGYYPAVGLPGDTHWPINEALPANIFYHAYEGARECSREIYSWARFNQVPVNKVLAFDVTHWHVIAEQQALNFDNEKSGVNWEDIPKSDTPTE